MKTVEALRSGTLFAKSPARLLVVGRERLLATRIIGLMRILPFWNNAVRRRIDFRFLGLYQIS
jgi:hypothetical protein